MEIRKEDAKFFANPEKGQHRIVFPLSGTKFIVFKTFDKTQKETFTFKIWEGDYESVVSHWQTMERIAIPVSQRNSLFKQVQKVINHFEGLLNIQLRESEGY